MKIKNPHIISRMKWLNLTLLIVLVMIVLVYALPVRVIANHIPLPLSLGAYIAVIAILLYRGNQYYEYDTAGEVFNLRTKNHEISRLLMNNEKKIDIPKSKIADYRVIQKPLKTELQLFIRTKKSKTGITKVKFSLSYMPKKELQQVKEDLENIITQNNKSQRLNLSNRFNSQVVY
ncbi:hypothetical protein [Vaginella massiliensis]|uniref:hypothetical protein n=1 Tax=Vaginella massiliensis TaxID=1816680 RepID=UPI000837BC35|nr:hypothetical protein [Vaginella massiliensis]